MHLQKMEIRKFLDYTVPSTVTKILLVKDHARNGKEPFCVKNHREYLCHLGGRPVQLKKKKKKKMMNKKNPKVRFVQFP